VYDCVLGLQDLWTRSSTDYTLLQRLELINRQHLPLRLTKSYDFPVGVLYFYYSDSAFSAETRVCNPNRLRTGPVPAYRIPRERFLTGSPLKT
jgi:hypothetical protein